MTNTTDNPKISIIIPVYNTEKYLSECLESVINQTYKNLEIICIDDGSTDKSLEILKKYAAKDGRIVVISQTNGGPAKARNVGLAKARGEYLWFIDADDNIDLTACEILYKITEEYNPDVILFATNVCNFATNKHLKDDTRSLTNIPEHLIDKKINIDDFRNIFDYIPTEAWNKVFNKNFIKQNNMQFNCKLYGMDDGYFTQEALIKAKSIFITNQHLYNYRISNPTRIVSFLLNVNLKNYQITIKYSNETLNLIKKTSLKQETIVSILQKNINRNFAYLNRCKGLVKSLYRYELKKHFKAILKIYPFIMSNTQLGYKINEVLRYKFISFKKIMNFLYRKKKIEIYEDFYKITKKKYYILGIQIIRKKHKEINLLKLQSSLINKFQRSLNIAFLHQETFSEFKNCNHGKTVVLVGAGPTVNYYRPIKNSIHVGCSRSILSDIITFDYLFTIDKISLDAINSQLLNYKNKNCIKFIGDINHGIDYQIPEDFRLACKARNYKTTCGLCPSRFTLDIDKEPLGSFHSVAFQAIQFIMFTNPKKVYLVGIDCGNNGKHFAGIEHNVANRGEDINELQNCQINEWKLFKKFVELYYPDTEIISVNPVGLKDVFTDVYTKEYLMEHPNINPSEVKILEEY